MCWPSTLPLLPKRCACLGQCRLNLAETGLNGFEDIKCIGGRAIHPKSLCMKPPHCLPDKRRQMREHNGLLGMYWCKADAVVDEDILRC